MSNFSFLNTAAQNATSFAATGLLGGTTYFWRVYAVTEGNTAFIAGSQATATPTPNTSLGTGLWSAPGTWSTGGRPHRQRRRDDRRRHDGDDRYGRGRLLGRGRRAPSSSSRPRRAP